ncbi:MAG: bile acid:sodium symporter family protein [Desulfovibrionales bacterium]
MILTSIPRLIERHFLVLAVVLSLLALLHPPLFTWIKPHIPLGLGLIMFGMGLTLRVEDFRDVLRKWKVVCVGMGLQYTVMPALALVISLALGLPREVMIGMVVLGACPGGTASNVIAYLARANVPLSISMTLASTCLAPVLTPAICYLILEQTVDIDLQAMISSVFWIVVFPLVDGLILRRILRHRLKPLLAWFPSLSITIIALLIACIIGLNESLLRTYPFLALTAVILHNGFGLAAGYGAGRLLGFSERDARTLSIEVGMQNSGLGVALAVKHFGAASALPGALFSLWHNVTGVSIAKVWRRGEEKDNGMKSEG